MKAIDKRRAAAGQSGFTLIELLVVIAILGILAGVVVFAVGNTTDNAKEKACKLEKRELKTALEAWKGNSGSDGLGADSDASGYPDDLANLADATLNGGDNKSKFLEEAPDAATWNYTPGTGEIVAQNGGKYDADAVTACNA